MPESPPATRSRHKQDTRPVQIVLNQSLIVQDVVRNNQNRRCQQRLGRRWWNNFLQTLPAAAAGAATRRVDRHQVAIIGLDQNSPGDCFADHGVEKLL